MKIQKLLLVATLTFLFTHVANAQSYTKHVLQQRLTFNEIVVNYPINTFDNSYQTRQWISGLTKSQANGSAGILNLSKANVFLLQESNSDGSAAVTAYIAVWSRLHEWHIYSIDVAGLGHLDAGVTVFSKQ